MNSTTPEKPKPKQLRPFAIVVTLIELGLAAWALVMMRRYWLVADGPLPGPFWGAAALFGFCSGLVLTNGVGMLQTLASLNRLRPLGSRLPVRLQAVEDLHQEIMVGLIPLILAFGLPVYPLFRLAHIYWQLWFIWIGLALMGTIVAGACICIIGRQLYLLWTGSQTMVELSHETIHPGQTIRVAVAYRPGRLATQVLEARLVCHQTVRQGTGRKGHKYVTTTLYEETLDTYHEADIPLLQLGSQPVTTTIPDDARLSTDSNHYPLIEWWIEVIIKVAQSPDFRLIFPFTVTE